MHRDKLCIKINVTQVTYVKACVSRAFAWTRQSEN